MKYGTIEMTAGGYYYMQVRTLSAFSAKLTWRGFDLIGGILLSQYYIFSKQ